MAWWRAVGRGSGALPVRSRSVQLREYAVASTFSSHRVGALATPASSTPPSLFTGVVDATRQFHSIHGHFAIPFGYRVPRYAAVQAEDDDSKSPLWPATYHGFPLGIKLKALLTNPKHRHTHESLVDELRDLGVPVDDDWREFLWQETTLKALTVYKQVYGDLLVPRNFNVPVGDPTWPRPTWGFRLGLRVMNMRQQRYDITPTEAEDLEEIGFVWDAHDHVWKTRVLPALQAFKAVYGHCNVKQQFVVPHEDPWPQVSWGLSLGHVVNTLRSPMATYTQQVQRDHEILEEIGFAWDSADDRWSRIMLPALQTYSRLYGSYQWPMYSFTVPPRAPWPKDTWNFNLGVGFHSIRRSRTYRHQVLRDADQLKAMGWFQVLTEKWGPLTS